MNILSYKPTRVSAAIIILIIWAGIYLPGLGGREVQGNEPKRMLPALTMVETGNWLTPELAGEKYYKKPPLINWMIATSFIVTGERNEFSARLPTTLLVLCFALCLVLMPSGWLTLDGRIISAVIFLTTIGIVDKGRLIEIDGAYASMTGMAVLTWLNLRSLNSSKWLLWTIPGFILGLGLLLKGPIILIFFYCVVFFVLKNEKKLSELRKAPHFTGILVMALVFSTWAISAFLANQGETAAKTAAVSVEEPKMSREWLSDVTDIIYGMDKFRPASWVGNIFQAMTYFLPWLLFIPFFRREKWIADIPETQRLMIKSLFWALVAGFIITSLPPGTKARYYVPLIPVAVIMTGFMLSNLPENNMAHRIWRNILLGLSILSALALAAGILLINMRYIAYLYGYFNMKPPSPLEYINYLPTFLVTVLTVSFLLFIFYNYKRGALLDSLKLALATGALVVVIMLQAFCFILPVARQYDMKRPVGTAINKCVPPGEPLYLFDFGVMNYEPFIFYIRQPVRYVFGDDNLTADVKHVLFEMESYGRRKTDYMIAARGPVPILEFRFKKKGYLIIKFEKPPPSFPKPEKPGRPAPLTGNTNAPTDSGSR